MKDYTAKHKDELAEWRSSYNKTYRKNNPDKVAMAVSRNREYYKKNKQLWMDILKKEGLLTYSNCGYSKCFAAIDFHHVGVKEKQVGQFIFLKPTESRLKEIRKCVPLCATCHREVHWCDNETA